MATQTAYNIATDIFMNSSFYTEENYINLVWAYSNDKMLKEFDQLADEFPNKPIYTFVINDFDSKTQDKLKEIFLQTNGGKLGSSKFEQDTRVSIAPHTGKNVEGKTIVEILFEP